MKHRQKGHASAWPFALSSSAFGLSAKQMAGVAAICLVSSGRWLLADTLPESLGPFAGAGLRMFMVGSVGVLVSCFLRRPATFPDRPHAARIGVACLGLIGVPYALLAAVAGRVPSTSVVLVFGGMPVLFAVAAGASAGLSLRAMGAGLAGLAGLLVVLPLQVPHGIGAVLGLGEVILAMGCTAACMSWLSRLLRGFRLFAAVGIAGLCNGVGLLLVAAASAVPHVDLASIGIEAIRCLLSDLPEAILLIWLLKEIDPQRVAVRYLAAPMLTVVEGLVLLRPGVNLRTVVGLTLLCTGAYGVLRAERDEEGAVLRLT